MKKWNIKVEMDLGCCECLISRYYEGIEAKSFEQAERIAFHKFIQDAIILRTVTKEFITKPYWMDIAPEDYEKMLRRKNNGI